MLRSVLQPPRRSNAAKTAKENNLLILLYKSFFLCRALLTDIDNHEQRENHNEYNSHQRPEFRRQATLACISIDVGGDYSRTYEIRIEKADTIIFLDYPLDTCLQGIESRIGKPRTDIPWKEDIFDPEFKQWIIDWFENTRPRVLSLLKKYKSVKRIVILSSRKEGDEFINSLQQLLT